MAKIKQKDKKMFIEYKELPPGIQEELKMEENRIHNSPSAETIYKNISGSLMSCNAIQVAEIFDVSISLVKSIERINSDL